MKTKRWLSILVVTVMVLAMSTTAFAGTDLITNGDFEAGNTGFTTDYTYVNATGWNTLGEPYVYAIGTDPYLYHSAWSPGFKDHTSGTGNMMIVNGTTEITPPNKIVWSQEITGLSCVNVPAVTEVDLIAGQHYDAGKVQLRVLDGDLQARFVFDGNLKGHNGWLITEMHVAVATNCDGIPQNKNHNPKVGQFNLNLTFNPGTLDTGWQTVPNPKNVPLTGVLCVAAHASITHAEVGHWETTATHDFCVSSGTETNVDLGGGATASAVVTTVNTWNGIDGTINAALPCEPPNLARYIWDAATVTADCADNGGLVNFVQNFNIIGTPKTATLMIAADNAFSFSLNGGTETDENLAPDWKTQVALGNFASADSQSDSGPGTPVVINDGMQTAWGDIYTYDILSGLNQGSNTLNVTALNADWNTNDPYTNPAMVIYKICGTSEEKEWVVDEPYETQSGWGEGNDFGGNNWAMCMDYTPEFTCDYGSYTLEFYAANSWGGNDQYPTGNPAQLQVTINGDVVGARLDLPTAVGNWVKYSATWNAGTANQANIVIRDVRTEFWGDDFCIDDISFIKQ